MPDAFGVLPRRSDERVQADRLDLLAQRMPVEPPAYAELLTDAGGADADAR